MQDKEILKLLKPLKRKYFLSKLVKNIFQGLHYYSLALLLMIVISKAIPISYIMNKSIVLFGISVAAVLVFSVYKRPKDIEIARKIDSFGLKERVVTSIEMKEETGAFLDIQRKDTIKHLKDKSLKEKIKIDYPKRSMLSTVIIIFIAVLIANISTPSMIKAKNIEKDRGIIEEEKENIEKIIEDVKEDKILTEAQKKDIENKLKELKKTMDKGKTLKDSDKEILKAKKELEKARDKLKEEEIKRLGEKLAQKDLTKELSQAVKEKDLEKIEEAMKKIEEKLKNMDKKDLEQAIKDLENLKESLEDKDIKEALESLAQNLNESLENLENLDIESEIANISSEIMESISSSSSQPAAITNGISKLEGMVSTGEISAQTPGQGTNGANGSGGKGQGSGNGLGSGSGEGQGEGSGGGAGSGSDNGSENGGNKPGSSGGGSKDKNDGGEKDYEKIHTPKYEDKEGFDTQIKGEKGDKGSVDGTQVKKFGDRAGEEVPYNEVLNSYKKSAYEKINTKDIPPSMKEAVKKYFTGLD